MKKPSEYIWDAVRRRALGAMIDLSKGNLRFLLLIADFGQGKSAFCEQVVRKLQWRFPIEWYAQRIRSSSNGMIRDFRAAEAIEYAEQLGLFEGMSDEAREAAEDRFESAFPCSVARDVSGVRRTLPGTVVRRLLKDLSRQSGRPMPDALDLLPLYGIHERPAGRYPLLVTGAGTDRPGTFNLKLIRAIEGPDRRPQYQFFYLRDLLREVPVFVVVDEADMLSVECLQELRQTCEESGTPYCLAGTKRLLVRLQTNLELRALLTRVEAQLTLEGVTAADLRSACPDMPNDIVLACWRAAGQNFRVGLLMIQTLRRLKEAFPNQRLTKRAVAFAASQVLAANLGRVSMDELPEESTAEIPVSPRQKTAAAAVQVEPARLAVQGAR